MQPPSYVHLKRLLYTTPATRPKKPRKEDVQVCACRPPPRADAPDGRRSVGSTSPSIACGRFCLNRHMHVLCDVKRCPAGESCTNKPFHLQPTPELEVFATQHCGLGLRTCQDIPKGAFVAEYLGCVVCVVVCGLTLVFKSMGLLVINVCLLSSVDTCHFSAHTCVTFLHTHVSLFYTHMRSQLFFIIMPPQFSSQSFCPHLRTFCPTSIRHQGGD